MKKNMLKMIQEVKVEVKARQRKGFRVTSQNLRDYANKILVDSEEYRKPSAAETYISQELENEYGIQKAEIADFKESVKKKASQPPSIQQTLSQLELSFSILKMQNVMDALRFAKRQELVNVRPKLIKLENSLSFKLQEEQLDPHLQAVVEGFL